MPHDMASSRRERHTVPEPVHVACEAARKLFFIPFLLQQKAHLRQAGHQPATRSPPALALHSSSQQLGKMTKVPAFTDIGKAPRGAPNLLVATPLRVGESGR